MNRFKLKHLINAYGKDLAADVFESMKELQEEGYANFADDGQAVDLLIFARQVGKDAILVNWQYKDHRGHDVHVHTVHLRQSLIPIERVKRVTQEQAFWNAMHSRNEGLTPDPALALRL